MCRPKKGKRRIAGYDKNEICIHDAVKKCIAQIQKGNYNDAVNNNLNDRQRTGTISRKDYRDIFLYLCGFMIRRYLSDFSR